MPRDSPVPTQPLPTPRCIGRDANTRVAIQASARERSARGKRNRPAAKARAPVRAAMGPAAASRWVPQSVAIAFPRLPGLIHHDVDQGGPEMQRASNTETALVTGTDFITQPVSDYDEAAEFYGETLGLEFSKRWGNMPAG